MIELPEQYGYRTRKSIHNIDDFAHDLKSKSYEKSIQKGQDNSFCYKVTYNELDQTPYAFETSYFIGVDWIVENEVPIYVRPKLDDKESEVNYIKMLFEALEEPDNYKHLDQLCEINFDKPTIKINQSQDLLTPLLLIQYLNVLKKIVRKGLRKSYYNVRSNMNARVKGKILVNETIKKNHFNNKKLYSYCQYSEFGINNTENKILKKALSFSISAIQNIKGIDLSRFNDLTNYIKPAFVNVDNEVNIETLRHIKPDNLFKEYEQALELAKYILRKYGYNISSINSTQIKTPPFWIDMSKLFELYVFSKLKERFPLHNEVLYHHKINYLEPDFILNSKDGLFKMVVDAKYKPRYEENRISVDDIRQISGYARLSKLYDLLKIEEDKLIDCLVVYSNQKSSRQNFINGNFQFVSEEQYQRFYKIGIELPIQSKTQLS